MTQQLLYTFIEIYRRLLYFHQGDLNNNLMVLSYPSPVKDAVKGGFIEPYSKVIPRSANWYKLTDKGKEFFKEFVRDKVDEHINKVLFDRNRFYVFGDVSEAKVFENVKDKITAHYNTFKY